MPMVSETLNFPRGTTGFTTSFSAQGGTGTLSQLAFDSVGLTVKKLVAYSKMPTELLADSVEAAGAYFLWGMAEAFQKTEDMCLISADGTSAYGGMRGLNFLFSDGNHTVGKFIAASGHNSFGTLDSTDIANAFALLPACAMRNAKIFCSVPAFGATFMRIAAATGGLTTQIGPDGNLQAYYGTMPIVFTQALPTATSSLSGQLMMCIGDMEKAVAFGNRRDLEITSFDETYADTDQVLIRATERIDIVAHDLGDNSTAGALVGLFGS